MSVTFGYLRVQFNFMQNLSSSEIACALKMSFVFCSFLFYANLTMNECSSVIFGVRLPNPHVSHVYHFCSWISVCRPIKCRKVLSSKLQEKAISRQVLVPYVQLDNYKQYTAHPSAYHHHHHDHISIFMHTHNSRIHDDPFTH